MVKYLRHLYNSTSIAIPEEHHMHKRTEIHNTATRPESAVEDEINSSSGQSAVEVNEHTEFALCTTKIKRLKFSKSYTGSDVSVQLAS
jgi:hypothetical protein